MFFRRDEAVPHAEVHVLGDRPVSVRCTCPIGRDHTHEEWLERFAGA